MTSTDNGIFVSPPPGRDPESFYQGGEIVIPNLSDEHFDESEKNTKANMIRGKRESTRTSKEWLSSEFTRSHRPCVVFKRKSVYKAQVEAILSTTCSDYVFFSKNLHCSFLYRDKLRKIVAMEVGKVPSREEIRQGWNKWVNKTSVFAESTRYFVEKNDSNVLEIHTMGLSSHDMKKLLDAGFKWNRDKQTWFGKEWEVNVEILENMVREDSLPLPSTMGIIPLWYCEKDNLEIDIEGESNKDQEGETLWNLLFGFGKME